MKLLSIIVPVYNVKSYLKKCVESIINQTYTNLQIILVDDGQRRVVRIFVMSLLKEILVLLSFIRKMVGSLQQEMWEWTEPRELI